MKITLSKAKNLEYKEQKEQDIAWSKKVKERDGYSCIICGSIYHPNAHHIIPRENKDFRYCLDNGVTLCTAHHKFSRIISAHNNPFAFFQWLENYKAEFWFIARGRTRDMLAKEGIKCS